MTDWTQGNWNAWVVSGAVIDESRKRCKQVPEAFRARAIDHARTFWALQERQPAPKSGFAGMSGPFQKWPLIEIKPEHWAAGQAHLENSRQERLRKFGDQVLGFAAEYAVAHWFTSKGIKHNHNPDPRNTAPDFTLKGLTVDLKSVSTKGVPQDNYDANLAEKQRLQSSAEWYLFGKYDNTTAGDYYILGFQTEQQIMEKGASYRKGDITRCNMTAPVDCWCIEYGKLIEPMKWLAQK